MIQLAVIKAAAGPVLAFAKANIVPIIIVSALAYTHWWAYSNGKETIEQKYEKQREALLEENARLQAQWNARDEELARKQVQELMDVTKENNERRREVDEYVRANPKGPECDLTQSDVDFLRQLASPRQAD